MFSRAQIPKRNYNQIELGAMKALPLGRTFHRQTQKIELPKVQARLVGGKNITPQSEENGTRQNKMKKSSFLNL